MPTILTHAFASYAAGKLIEDKKFSGRVLITGMCCSMLPDVDVIAFSLNIPYESFWGHRGFTHSLFFALLLTSALMLTMEHKSRSKEWWFVACFYFISIASHGLLDALTNGGRGVAFFSPFNNERFFFPYRPIKVSPINIESFLNRRGLSVLASEFLIVWLPLTLAVAVRRRFRMR